MKIKNWRHYAAWLLNLPVLRDVLPAKWYIGMRYFEHFGQYPDYANPKTFNEKLQWIKVYDHNPSYTQMVDKFGVRELISDSIGEEYLIPLVGGPWKSFDEIDFSTLPNQFVLKCTHDSASAVICEDKEVFNLDKARSKLNAALNYNFYWFGREWPYKNVSPRIIAEQYMVDESGVELKDYKLFCFNGEPRLVQVNFGRFTEPKKNMYDCNWNYLPITSHYPTDPDAAIAKPARLEDMLQLSRRLSRGHPFLRVDFYSIGDKIYFGELTFFPGSGFIGYEPDEWNFRLGDWLRLPR